MSGSRPAREPPRPEPRPGPGPAVGSVALNIGIFLVFVALTLVFVYRASRTNKTASDYYAAGRSFTGPQNGVAIAGDYLSAASFLGIAGAIAINGYDGFLYSIGFLVAWLVALLLVAELLRNTGKYTMGDVLAFRMRQRPVRAAAATSTLVVSFFYLLAQMAGAGGLIALLLQIPNSNRFGQSIVIAVVGILMIVYVLVGGMKGTTYVQIIKAVLLIIGAAVMTVVGAGHLRLQPVRPARRRGRGQPEGRGRAEPGPAVRRHPDREDRLHLAGAGPGAGHRRAAAHPDALLHRAHSAKEARRSVVWAIWLIGLFYLFTLVLGYGAAALVGPEKITAAPGGVNSAAPLLAFELGRRDPARAHLGGGLRHHPGRGGRADHHRVGLVRARRLRQRDQARADLAGRRGAGWPGAPRW